MGLQFNGTNNVLDAGDNLDLATGGSMSVCAWVKRAAINVRHEVISKEPNGGSTGFEMACTSGTNKAQFGAFNGSFPVAEGTTTIAAGTVYHLCGTYDGTNLRLYVNGVLETTNAIGSTGNVNANSLLIGGSANAGRFFNGVLEDVRMYSRALTADEILTIYSAKGRDYILGGLAARWPLTGASGETIGGYSILNHQSNSITGVVGATITLSYTIPAGLVSPVLVVVGGAENAVFNNCQPSACTFGSTSMTKRVGTQTTLTMGAGSAIFTLGVTAGDSQTITLTFPGTSGDASTGRIVQAFVVEGATDSINTSASQFNNSGNITGNFTTSVARKVGIIHFFTGDNTAASGTAGTGNTQIGEVTVAGSGFSSRVGYFDAAAAAAYSGYGFTFGSGPSRCALTMIALDLATVPSIKDYSLGALNATQSGAAQSYVENIGLEAAA